VQAHAGLVALAPPAEEEGGLRHAPRGRLRDRREPVSAARGQAGRKRSPDHTPSTATLDRILPELDGLQQHVALVRAICPPADERDQLVSFHGARSGQRPRRMAPSIAQRGERDDVRRLRRDVQPGR
jgi:hypothetical protein